MASSKSLDERIEYVETHIKGYPNFPKEGVLLAAELGLACLPVRKKGKLPGQVISYNYSMEYGSNTFEVQVDAIKNSGLKCLIVDDLLATGGSILASIKLLQKAGVEVIGCLVIMELVDLKGKDKIPKEIPCHSLIKY